MKTYILTIEFLNENNNIEYKTIEGVYAEKEVAKSVATRKLKAQKSMWEGSYARNIGKGKVALIAQNGYSKIYHIQEMEVK